MQGATGTEWKRLTVDVGRHLAPYSNRDMISFVRRIGLILDGSLTVNLLLGQFTLIDPHFSLF